MQVETFEILHYKNKIPVVIPANKKRRSNVVLMLDPVNVFPFHKQIYIYIKVQKLSGDFRNLKSEVRILKSEI